MQNALEVNNRAGRGALNFKFNASRLSSFTGFFLDFFSTFSGGAKNNRQIGISIYDSSEISNHSHLPAYSNNYKTKAINSDLAHRNQNIENPHMFTHEKTIKKNELQIDVRNTILVICWNPAKGSKHNVWEYPIILAHYFELIIFKY